MTAVIHNYLYFTIKKGKKDMAECKKKMGKCSINVTMSGQLSVNSNEDLGIMRGERGCPRTPLQGGN